jgi:CRISPR-associated protein Cmr5
MSEQKQTLDQKRAGHGWDVVKKIAELPDKVEDGLSEAAKKERAANAKTKREFGTQAKKLPTRILTAGLGQALAFLEAKDYAPGLRNALTNWIKQRRPLKADEKEEQLFVRVLKSDAEFLRFATAECLAYLTWLVRWCDALGLKGDDQEAK